MTNQEYINEHPEKFVDDIDKWLYNEFYIVGGCCSAQGSMEYSVARMVAERLFKAQGLEYKDGKIVEIKREHPKPISAIDLEKRITSVEEKLCELQDRLEQNAHEY